MDTFLTIIQGISIIVLTLVGILSKTFDHIKRELTPCGLKLLIISSIVFVFISVLKDVRSKQNEYMLIQKIDELRDAIFEIKALKIMEAPKDTSQSLRPKSTDQITVTLPLDNSQVQARTYIEGKVSDAQTKVWVVIHPLGVSSYWVQPGVNVKEDGTWRVMAYFGRSGNIDEGRLFEIIAIANPKDELNEGDVLSGWPAAQWSSQVITVRRQ